MTNENLDKRVLIGDDNQTIRAELLESLVRKNFAVDLASTPEEMIQKAKSGDYFAVVTDLEYTPQGREGYAVLDELKENPALKILYTGKREFECVAEGLVFGADYVITKKDQTQLIEVLENNGYKTMIKGGN